MSGDVADTLERGGVLLAEAPTGVGKSLRICCRPS
jgi:Rad3-related DNA helicase